MPDNCPYCGELACTCGPSIKLNISPRQQRLLLDALEHSMEYHDAVANMLQEARTHSFLTDTAKLAIVGPHVRCARECKDLYLYLCEVCD